MPAGLRGLVILLHLAGHRPGAGARREGAGGEVELGVAEQVGGDGGGDAG